MNQESITIPIEGRGKHLRNMLLKLQRMQETNDKRQAETDPVLVYNKDRSVQMTVPFKDVAYLFEEHDDKIYCTAREYENGLEFGRKVAPLSW